MEYGRSDERSECVVIRVRLAEPVKRSYKMRLSKLNINININININTSLCRSSALPFASKIGAEFAAQRTCWILPVCAPGHCSDCGRKG